MRNRNKAKGKGLGFRSYLTQGLGFHITFAPVINL